MEYVTLGKTGLRVSRMGLGGIPIQRIDAEGTKTLLHKLADQGVNRGPQSLHSGNTSPIFSPLLSGLMVL